MLTKLILRERMEHANMMFHLLPVLLIYAVTSLMPLPTSLAARMKMPTLSGLMAQISAVSKFPGPRAAGNSFLFPLAEWDQSVTWCFRHHSHAKSCRVAPVHDRGTDLEPGNGKPRVSAFKVSYA